MLWPGLGAATGDEKRLPLRRSRVNIAWPLSFEVRNVLKRQEPWTAKLFYLPRRARRPLRTER